MKRLSGFFLLISVPIAGLCQNINIYQSGISGQENLQAIANLSPTSPGGMGFDNRYEGVKGSTRLFDTLYQSYLLVKGQDKYIQFRSDIDVIRNTLLFAHPNSGKHMELPSDIVAELIINVNERDLIFRTTNGLNFEKALRENKFYQVLLSEPNRFIVIPEKNFIEADYKAAYSADRRYDEYQPYNKYFLEGDDNIFYQIQLNRKSLLKMFPDKKDIINMEYKQKNNLSDEEKVISILKKL